MMAEYIKKEDAVEAVWRILNGMGYSQKHNDLYSRNGMDWLDWLKEEVNE